MKKKIAVITFLYEVALQHKSQIEALFGDTVEISVHAFDRDSVDRPIDADLVVISIYPVYVAVEQYLNKWTQVVIISTTINSLQYAQIMAIPSGERVLVVNYSREMTMESLALFKHLGINHIELLPYYPGKENVPDVQTAITLGEAQHIPMGLPHVIDIGHRVLAAGTLVELAIKLGMGSLIQTKGFAQHLESLKSYSVGMPEILGRTYALEGEMQSLLDILEDGIVAVNLQGIVHGMNQRAEEIFNISRTEILEKDASDILKEIPFGTVLQDGVPLKNQLIRVREQNVRATVVPVKVAGFIGGAIAMLREFSREEKAQHELRVQLLNRGYRARYTFADIIGETLEMKELKAIAGGMARSDGSVLISGESGTGKELFAQAMHNASARREYQFVAVNCAALPESILESELFGYEEGAFTGARKGGKPGLFELAHNGSLFLDEIGEMAPHLQSRLLRVLQEREVVRLGGDRVIKVDIRLFAATNVNLMNSVRSGNFRKDLYYRLNVLPLKTIPLRERLTDIPILVRSKQRELGANFQLAEDAMALLLQCTWEGNVRQLQNVVEYMAYLEKSLIQEKDLKNLDLTQSEGQRGEAESEQFDEILEELAGEEAALKAVLQVLWLAFRENRRVGRRTLVESPEGVTAGLSESQCRRILKCLAQHGIIRLMNGRGGTRLTQSGQIFARQFTSKL